MNRNLVSSDIIHTRALLSITEMYALKQLIDLFTDTAAILISIVSNSYYGMPRGQIHINLPLEHSIMSFETIEIKMAAVSVKRSIDEPTRITPSSSTLNDLIFTSHQDNLFCSGMSQVGISDHSFVYACHKIQFPFVQKEST